MGTNSKVMSIAEIEVIAALVSGHNPGLVDQAELTPAPLAPEVVAAVTRARYGAMAWDNCFAIAKQSGYTGDMRSFLEAMQAECGGKLPSPGDSTKVKAERRLKPPEATAKIIALAKKNPDVVIEDSASSQEGNENPSQQDASPAPIVVPVATITKGELPSVASINAKYRKLLELFRETASTVIDIGDDVNRYFVDFRAKNRAKPRAERLNFWVDYFPTLGFEFSDKTGQRYVTCYEFARDQISNPKIDAASIFADMGKSELYKLAGVNRKTTTKPDPDIETKGTPTPPGTGNEHNSPPEDSTVGSDNCKSDGCSDSSGGDTDQSGKGGGESNNGFRKKNKKGKSRTNTKIKFTIPSLIAPFVEETADGYVAELSREQWPGQLAALQSDPKAFVKMLEHKLHLSLETEVAK